MSAAVWSLTYPMANGYLIQSTDLLSTGITTSFALEIVNLAKVSKSDEKSGVAVTCAPILIAK